MQADGQQQRQQGQRDVHRKEVLVAHVPSPPLRRRPGAVVMQARWGRPRLPIGRTGGYRPRGSGSSSGKLAARFSARAVKASIMSAGWNIPDCQVAIWSSASSTEWSRA